MAALLGTLVTAVVLNQSSGSSGVSTQATDLFPSTQPTSSVESPSAGSTRDPRLPAAPLSTFSADLDDNRPQRSKPPTRLTIAALDLDFAIRPLGVDKGGAMALPDTVRELSWYKFGSGPLDAGATVIAGHVDTKSEGIGPLARLASLEEGDRIAVNVAKQEVTYRVDAVRQVSKSLLDLDALFARSGPRRLHLVTCAGAYDADRGGYQANLVVIARPVD